MTAASAIPERSTPQGDGVAEFKASGEIATCKGKTADLASYLQRQGLGLTGRNSDGALAAVWLVELQNNPDAHIAFAGFDGDARQVARARSIGSTRKEGLNVFDTGGAWTVTWFDAEGLAYARPRWETSPPGIQHLANVGKEAGENVALAPTPKGALVAAAPFGSERTQLGVFLFAPTDPAEPNVRAIGVTHHTKQPRRPAIAADASGYFVAWHEEDGSIQVSRFDASGKEGEAHEIAPEGPRRERVALVATPTGALALWAEGETLMSRALDASAKPTATTWVVGKGKWGTAASAEPGALVAWVGNDGKADGRLLLTRLGQDGAPSAQGVRVSDGINPVKDPPAIAVAGARVGLAWTEIMGPSVSTKRALLRLLDAACIP
ncbi:hypothetical protein [Chondromyces apiculatus]|uniref:Uncharacterized protein n=1 Tax=Chondromyces apiculatus DSM 436 TaxID=1192034 RepID=A0A017T562_9BACT|nr:hypothetical protein [Chondromyces apiculatus]EYF03696.1 Hypothetical protein CAP_5307 [Chondromyces apiculatus DSM 436]